MSSRIATRFESMLAQDNRIKRSADYKRVFETGQKMFGRYVIVFFSPNQLENSRFGIITSKKLGNAVVRNRARRQIREIIRLQFNDTKARYDVVIVARAAIVGKTAAQIQKDLYVNFRKAGLC